MLRFMFLQFSFATILCLLGGSSSVFADESSSTDYRSGEGIEKNIVEGDANLSFTNLRDWYEQNGGYKIDETVLTAGRCKKVVGMAFDFAASWDQTGIYDQQGQETDDTHIFYYATDIVGEKHSVETTEGKHKISKVKDIYWSFQVTTFFHESRKPEKLMVRPDPIRIKVGDSMRIRLTNIVDSEGNPPEPGEQLMVSVDKGSITNGMPLGDYKVFDVLEGSVDVTYQAPNDLSVHFDNIEIHNLCVKGDELVEIVPLRLITQKPITIEFPPLVARITRTLEQSRRTSIDETKYGDLRKVRKGNSLSTKRVSIIASFSDDPGTGFFAHEFQMKHTKVHYRMVDCRVASQIFSYNGEYYSADYDAQGLTKEFTTRTTRQGTAGRINPPCDQNYISLKAGASQGAVKAKRMNLPFFDVEFQVDEHLEVTGKKQGTDRQLVPYERTSSRNYSSEFAIQPTVVKDREACFDVTGGDGVRVMSGRCTDTFEQPGDDLHRTTHEVYEWQVYRR